ncbi:hypothetical protein [uncultured Shewanella sp.]|uniref:hypothetical protein n=1 Tax=uncultured Shewanella sp. TaxID=173975 RepID=UPI00261FF01C|nr:hypothetical protein [uncultured Shewanella sp.]
MTKYVACFIVIISLLGQSLLLSVSAEPSIGVSTEISPMTQSQPLSAGTLNHQYEINTETSVTMHDVKIKDVSQCEKSLSQCVQLDSGHCTAHSYCHSGALLPMTIMVSSMPLSSKIMTISWSAKTITNPQDFRPPIV